MVLGYLLSLGYVFVILIIAAAAEKYHILEQEGRRKFVHIMLVFTWVIMIHFLTETIHLVLIPVVFVLLNSVSYITSKKGTASIPVLSSMERTGEEETPGTVYYACSMMMMGIILCFRKDMLISCGIGLFCLAFGDGMAGVIGKKSFGIFKKQLFSGKTLGGSLACIVFAVIGCSIWLLLMGKEVLFLPVLTVGIVCAILELPGYGLDNLSIPLGCMFAARMLGM